MGDRAISFDKIELTSEHSRYRPGDLVHVVYYHQESGKSLDRVLWIVSALYSSPETVTYTSYSWPSFDLVVKSVPGSYSQLDSDLIVSSTLLYSTIATRQRLKVYSSLYCVSGVCKLDCASCCLGLSRLDALSCRSISIGDSINNHVTDREFVVFNMRITQRSHLLVIDSIVSHPLFTWSEGDWSGISESFYRVSRESIKDESFIAMLADEFLSISAGVFTRLSTPRNYTFRINDCFPVSNPSSPTEPKVDVFEDDLRKDVCNQICMFGRPSESVCKSVGCKLYDYGKKGY